MIEHASRSSFETRRRILSAARALLEERGRSGLRGREVARRANVSASVVLHYFGSRDGLLDACFDAFYEGLHERAGTLRSRMASGPAEAIVEEAVRTGFRYCRAHRVVLRAFLAGVVEAGETDPRRRRLTQGPLLRVAGETLAKRLHLSPAEARLRVQSITLLVARYAVSTAAELELLVGSHADVERAVEDHLVAAAARILSG